MCVCVCGSVNRDGLRRVHECVGWPVLCVARFDLCPRPDAIQLQ